MSGNKDDEKVHERGKKNRCYFLGEVCGQHRFKENIRRVEKEGVNEE